MAIVMSESYNMNALFFVSVVCLFAVSAANGESYPAEYDKEPVDELLSNEDKEKMFGGCLLDDLVCTERAIKLKGILLDALQTKCSKCSDVLKGHIRKTVKFYSENRPELWKKVLQTHDPEGLHTEGIKQFMQAA